MWYLARSSSFSLGDHMIFKVRRASGLPIALEPEEEHALLVLEQQGRWEELEHLERDLRKGDALKEINVESDRYEELVVLLGSLNCPFPVTIDFQRKTIVILDNGDIVS